MHIGSSSPGFERFGLPGWTSAQYRKLLKQSPVPGTTTPLPKGLPRLCVMQIRLPSASATESEVVCAGSSLSCGTHCSVGPVTGLPSVRRWRRRATEASDMISASFSGEGLLWAMRSPAARRIAR